MLNYDSVKSGFTYLLHSKGTELYQRYSGRHAPSWLSPDKPFDD
jgi:hypothetical protein